MIDLIDRAAYTALLIRCLLLEAEVHALRAHAGRRAAARAQRERVCYLREERRMTYAKIGERLGLSAQAARRRYLEKR